MRKVTHRDRVLLVDVRDKRTLVVNTEREDAVLVGYSKGSGVGSAVGGEDRGEQRKAVVGVKHGEFKLEGIGGGDTVWVPAIAGVLR